MGAMPYRIANSIKVILEDVAAVFYFGRLIALVNAGGAVVWRDGNYPLFLVEYLLEFPPPQSRWN